MYSDFLELPSKDCFPFSDQLLCFDISKLNEFDNHINFDNIYDSYYSSSIQYNTNFELSENCKNLSFSKLFDSELFSTDENEDCSLKLKIEKEEELNPCFSPDNLQATSEEHNLVKVDENISSSLLPNNFTPKIGINRTLIKSTENCDINHFIYNPFQETKDLGVKHTSVLHFFKCEPENNESTEETTVDMEVKPCYPSDSLQDNTMACSLIKSKDDVTSSSLKNSFREYGKMSKTTIKTVKNDECKEILSTDEMSVNNKSPIMKFEPIEINDTINQNIEVRENPISSYNSANTLIDNHKVRSKENNVSKLPNILISKRKSIHKSSKKPIETYDVKLVEKNEVLDIHQKSVYDKIPIKIKSEPVEINDTINQNIEMKQKTIPSDNLANTLINNHKMKSKKDNISKLPNILISKRQSVHKGSKKSIKTYDAKLVAKSEVIGIDQMPVHDKIPIIKIKSEPMEIDDTINQNIEMRVKSFSSDNSKNTLITNHSMESQEGNVLCSLPKKFISKRQSNRKASKKTVKNYNEKRVIKNEVIDIDQMSDYDKIPIIKIKSEPVDINDTINQNVEMREKPFFSDNSKNILITNHSMESKEGNVLSSLPKKIISKRQSVLKASKKPIKKYDVKHVAKNEVISIDQMSAYGKIPITKIKTEPLDINDTINQNIEMRENPFYYDNSANTLINNHRIKRKENVLFSLSNGLISKCQSVHKASKKPIKNDDVKHVAKNEYISIDQMSAYGKIPIKKIKSEPMEIDDTINQNIEMRVKSFSSDNSADILITNHSMESKEGNVLSSLPKKFISKRQSVLKASKKPIKNYDLKHVTKNEAISIDQRSAYGKIPITKIKSEPVDINDTINQNIQIRVKPFSYDNSANTLINNHGIKPKESNVVFSLSNGLITKRQSVHKASKKPIKNDDVKHIAKNEIISIDQMSAYGKIPIKKIKSEPMEIDDTINQNIEMRVKPFSSDTPAETLINNHRIKSKESNVLVSLSNGLISKCQSVHKASKKPIKNYAKLVAKSEVIGIGQMPVHDKIPIIKIKSEPMEIDDTINQNIEMKVKPFSSDYDSLKQKKDSVSPSLLNKSISKRPDKASNQTIINQDKHITNNNCDKELGNMKKKLVNKTLLKVELPNIRETINQNNDMKVESYCLNEKLPKMMIDNHSFVKIKDNVLSSLPQNVINRQGTHKMSMKNDERCDVQNMNNNFCKTSVGHLSSNVKITTVKSEFHDIDDAVEQNIVKINEQDSEKNPNNICKEVKHLNNLDIENVKVINIKKENIVPNTTSLKNDIISQTCTINNGTNLETEKKKISWEEFRAKRGKMGLLNNLENNEAPVANDKLEAIIKEFDQNTAEHFIGQKRKIEEPNSIVQEISTEDQELQKKRMKIEYIKQLLPSSFASEIAKTSSLMKGHLLENIENENTLDDSIMSNDKTQGKYSDIHDDLGYPTKGDKYKKKNLQSRVYSSRHNSSRSNCNKTWSLSSSNSDDYYNHGEIDTLQHAGQYGQNTRKMVSRSKFVDQKKVVYVGQIPIKYGKRYLYNRFKMFGKIQSLTLHKKPDFRVYYAFVTYSEKSEAERAISHGNNDKTQVQLDIRFGERKQTQNPYYDLDDEWLTDWYTYKLPEEVVKSPTPEKVSFEEELQEFYKLAQIKKQNQVNPSQVS